MYDPSIINRVLPDSFQIGESLAHRLPVALVLLQGVACLLISLRMVEPKIVHDEGIGKACRDAVSLTLETAKWVFVNPMTRVVVIIGLSIDSVVRNFATINSSYYRLIELPEWSYGLIGATIGVGGYLVPSIASRLNKRFDTLINLAIVALLALIGLGGLIPANSWWCLLPATVLMMTLGLLGFTMSRALNRAADSSKRATVLSVKGLSFNLGYGTFSLAFSMLLAGFAESPEGNQLRSAILWQVPFFAVLTGSLLVWGKRVLAKTA